MTGAQPPRARGHDDPSRSPLYLSRDSWLGQRKGDTLVIQIIYRLVDCAVECIAVGEGLMGEMVRLEIMPDDFDVVQLRRILGQPLDGEPVSTGGQRRQRKSAGMDRAIVLDQHDRFDRLSGPGTIKPVELLEMGDKVAASLGRAGVDDELARDVIKRA